jgi:hypothetical protein
MTYLENSKQYTGSDLENIFFRPILTGQSAKELGVRVLYNMPQAAHIQLWDGQRNILQKFTTAGWNGSTPPTRTEKTINLQRVKAEIGFSAADYFSMVYEKISTIVDVNMEDLSGTILERAETELFRQVLAENIRATMWAGNSAADDGYNTFDGFLKLIEDGVTASRIVDSTYTESNLADNSYVTTIFDQLWTNADPHIQDLKTDGQLAYFVSSDLCYLYEKHLDQKGVDAAYIDAVNGRPQLAYHGIPVIDVRMGSYLADTSLHQSFALLTDRRNLVMAVNTADMPGNEVRMWYNPDVMENRQRAVFMAGCLLLDEKLITYAYKQ